MTAYEPGDVVLVPYPFGERAGGRKRPAVVISGAAYTEDTGELIVAQVTGRMSDEERTGDCLIDHWKEANLLRPSLVRARLATLKTELVLRHLGKLNNEDFLNVHSALMEAFPSQESANVQ